MNENQKKLFEVVIEDLEDKLLNSNLEEKNLGFYAGIDCDDELHDKFSVWKLKAHVGRYNSINSEIKNFFNGDDYNQQIISLYETFPGVFHGEPVSTVRDYKNLIENGVPVYDINHCEKRYLN